MIGTPHNDHECLGAVTDEVIERVSARDPALATLAERFDDTDKLAAWFRSLPQRDDEGQPCDGPRSRPAGRRSDSGSTRPIPTASSARARWMGAAELIDAGRGLPPRHGGDAERDARTRPAGSIIGLPIGRADPGASIAAWAAVQHPLGHHIRASPRSPRIGRDAARHRSRDRPPAERLGA